MTETAKSASGVRANTCSAISDAMTSLTGPGSFNRAAGISSHFDFVSNLYTTADPQRYSEIPGTRASDAATSPAVQLSAKTTRCLDRLSNAATS